MSFPLNPVTGQTTVTNNISYVYNSAGTGYWTRNLITTSTVANTPVTVVIGNSSSATSTSTGALQVVGGVGIGGTLYVGSFRADASTSATTWGLFYNIATKEITTATGGSGISSTATTSTFTIFSTEISKSTTTGALRVLGGVGVGGDVFIGGNINVNGITTITNTSSSISTITGALTVAGGVGVRGDAYVGGNVYTTALYDLNEATNNSFVQPSIRSKLTNLTVRGSELFPSNDTFQIGPLSVTRGGITSVNTVTFYGLYNRTGGGDNNRLGIGIDSSSNLWFGKVTNSSTSTRTKNLFYSNPDGDMYVTGDIYAGGSFKSSGVISYANNTAYYLDFATTTTKHIILSNAVSPNLIGYDPSYGVYIGGTDYQWISNGTTSTSGPLWINSQTSYTILHSGNYNTYAASTTTFTNPVLIRLTNTSPSGSTATSHLTLANPGNGNISGIYWRFGATNSLVASIRVTDNGDITYNSASGVYKFQTDFGSSSTSFSNSTTTFMNVDWIGNVNLPKNLSVAKLIDADDATYFLDPNSTSTINQLTLKGVFISTVAGTAGTWTDVVYASSAAGGTYISASRPAISTGEVGYKWMTGTATIWTSHLPINDGYALHWRSLGVTHYTMSSAGTLSATNPGGSQVQSTIFADVNNAGYYVKPAGYSYINSLVLGGSTTSRTTGTGLKIFTAASNSFTNTLFWNDWNWQTDGSNNATLWYGTLTQIVTVTGNGILGVNQPSVPSGTSMVGGMLINGTGTTQVSVINGTTSGFSIRVSDSVFGDFSLYDNAANSWKLALNAQKGSVGINTTASTAYGLSVGGDIYTSGSLYAGGISSTYPPYGLNFSGTTILNTLNAVQHGWYLTSSTAITFSSNNTFETAAVFGADHVLGSGSLVDLFAWNPPTTTEYYNGNPIVQAWVSTVTDVKSLFIGQNSIVSAANSYYLTGINNQAVRFTWNGFNNKFWDALLIGSNTAGVVLNVTIESSTSTSTSWVIHSTATNIGSTGVQSMHYLRTQGSSVGQYFRLTIKETTGNAATVSLSSISLLGTKGPGSTAQRLLNWDVSKNIITYGNVTTKIVYDTLNTAYYLAPSAISSLYTSTHAGDVLTQGQGRFMGWYDSPTTSTKTYGVGVEIGVNNGVAAVAAYNRTTTATGYTNLGIYGGLSINITPVATGTVTIGGKQWIDGDDARFYVKPSTGTVIYNLKAYGPVQFVNTGGTNYNQNIRLPRPGSNTDNSAIIAMASDLSGAGNILGQWNLEAEPLTGNAAYSGRFIIRSGTGTVALSIATATNTTTFNYSVFAPKYLGSTEESYYLIPNSTSYLRDLTVGPAGRAYPVLTSGPLDDYLNTFTYVHTSFGVDTVKNFNSTGLSYMSYSGGWQAPSTDAASPIAESYYTLYQAAHRGGAGSDGMNYSSQIAIPMTSAVNANRMFIRAKVNSSWNAWREVLTVATGTSYTSVGYGAYDLYVNNVYNYQDSRYVLALGATTVLPGLSVYNNISSWLSATPTTVASGTLGQLNYVPAMPRLGSAEWVFPTATVESTGTSTVYRQGLYAWQANTSLNTPVASGFYAGVGFGKGTLGAAEISANYKPKSGHLAQGLYFRTLDGASTWTMWAQVLEATTHPYAARLNQDLRTSDSPTFLSITITNAPTFNQMKAASYWTLTGSNTAAKFILPWAGTGSPGGAGGFGAYAANANVNEASSFRFDSVSTTATVTASVTTGIQPYEGNPNVNIYVGPNKVISASGAEIFSGKFTSNSDSLFYAAPSGTSKFYIVDAVNGINLSGDNATNKSAKISFGGTTNRGLINVDYCDTGGDVSYYGTVATWGTSRGSWDGYVISAEKISGTIWRGAAFLKNRSDNVFALRGGSEKPIDGEHWAIVANNAAGSGTKRMNINATGYTSAAPFDTSYNVKLYGSLYCTDNVFAYSDRRKKENIDTINNALDKVLQLRGVTYNRIDAQPEDVGRREMGVIAQEVIEVLPEVVKYSDSSDEFSVAYGNMAGIFIEAIKDLKKELDELKTELNMLKGKQ